MPRPCATLILSLIALCAVSSAHADTINLKNGGSITGIIEKEDDKSVEVDMGFGAVILKRAEIKYIERSSAEESREMVRTWEDKRQELKSKEREFAEARDKRFENAYENWVDEAKARKLSEGTSAKQISITREPGGKGVIVEVLLNDKVKVSLMLDTGASVIALSRKVGEDLGIDLSDDKKDIMDMRLADGRRTRAKAVILDSVKIQGIEVKNVMAAIMIDQIPSVGITEGLLGMSFLSRFNLKTDLKSMKMSLEKIE